MSGTRADRRNVNTLETFWQRVDKDGAEGCWLWTGGRSPDGYGQFWMGGEGGRTLRAHRVAYEDLVGAVPEGLMLDHLCRVRHCVRPDHLEPVTNAENLRRGAEARRAESPHCPHGHLWTPDNTVYGSHGYRMCRTCRNEAIRRSRLNAAGANLKPGDPLPPLRSHGLKTECKWGHDISNPQNVLLDKYGHRHCRECGRRRNRELSARRKTERQARSAAA